MPDVSALRGSVSQCAINVVPLDITDHGWWVTLLRLFRHSTIDDRRTPIGRPTHVLQHHDVIDEKDTFALEEFPDCFAPLPLHFRQDRHLGVLFFARNQLWPMNVLDGEEWRWQSWGRGEAWRGGAWRGEAWRGWAGRGGAGRGGAAAWLLRIEICFLL